MRSKTSDKSMSKASARLMTSSPGSASRRILRVRQRAAERKSVLAGHQAANQAGLQHQQPWPAPPPPPAPSLVAAAKANEAPSPPPRLNPSSRSSRAPAARAPPALRSPGTGEAKAA